MRIASKGLLAAAFAAKGDFRVGLEPPPRLFDGITIAPFKGNARAAVTISADFELSWAFRHHGPAATQAKALQERENTPPLLQLLDDHAFPITFATVGHLFLEGCTRDARGLPHPEMPRPAANPLWQGDWYKHDPCTDYRQDPLWYAPDLIELIRSRRVRHELGTHSFSHIDFSAAASDTTLVRGELAAAVAAMRSFGLAPRSLVYPFNRMGHGHLPLLAQHGVVAVRHRDRRVRLSYPERTPSGVYKLYESMNLRVAKHYDYVDKVRIYLAKAMKRSAAFHLWFHPSDPVRVVLDTLRPIIRYLDALRQQGLVWVTTMADLASYCEARATLRPEVVERGATDMTIVWRGSFPAERFGHTELSLVLPPLPPPRLLTLTDASSCSALSYARTATGHLLLNLPTNARSLYLAF